MEKVFDFRKEQPVLHTDGKGLWSSFPTDIRIEQIVFDHDEWREEEGAPDGGELRVYFNKLDWDVHAYGLIYTDDLFEEELKTLLEEKGIYQDYWVAYSEQGMQGRYYVSLDFGAEK